MLRKRCVSQTNYFLLKKLVWHAYIFFACVTLPPLKTSWAGAAAQPDFRSWLMGPGCGAWLQGVIAGPDCGVWLLGLVAGVWLPGLVVGQRQFQFRFHILHQAVFFTAITTQKYKYNIT